MQLPFEYHNSMLVMIISVHGLYCNAIIVWYYNSLLVYYIILTLRKNDIHLINY